jgi:NAD(P)-dependent dehydrogenase (short-subunit alcohol dehydrogenase family)
MSFSGKTVAITGGGTGIGRACAKSFLDRGARVVLNGRRADVLRETARELDPSGKLVRVVPGDVAQRETGRKLVSTALDAFGGLDVLLNAAGIFKPTPFLEHTDADLEAYLGAILKGTFYASQAAVPALTHNLAIELGKDNIRVNTIAPSVVDFRSHPRGEGPDFAKELVSLVAVGERPP